VKWFYNMGQLAMPETDPGSEFAKELAKQLPVGTIYKDGLQPATRATGTLLEDIAKTIQLALAPFQLLAAYQDRLRNFIDKSVRRVPPEKQVSPPPQILGPVVEGIRYEPEGTPIEEMFSQLLSRAMDNDRAGEAHPAYPFIIKQLSADEAKMLFAMKSQAYKYTQTHDYIRGSNLFSAGKVEKDEFPRDNLTFPENVSFYMDHLYQLGLAGLFQIGNQQPLYSGQPPVQVGVRIESEYRLTELGKRFVQACTG
jgi:hypothetical protein